LAESVPAAESPRAAPRAQPGAPHDNAANSAPAMNRYRHLPTLAHINKWRTGLGRRITGERRLDPKVVTLPSRAGGDFSRFSVHSFGRTR
jgi:hypothetical protein